MVDVNEIARRAMANGGRYNAGPPVPGSMDLERVLVLPRRKLDLKDPRAAEAWTSYLRRERTEPCDCVARWGFCIERLRDAQAWALENAMDARGLFGALGVGDGKTGIALLLPMAIPGVTRALLLIQPNLKAQLLTRDYPQWSAHFKTPIIAGLKASHHQIGRPTLHVATYNEISQAKNSDLFKRIDPQLIIADEAQNIGDVESVRTGRFLRSFADKPSMMFCAQTGSFSSGSITQFAHFLGLAFRERSPMPHDPQVTKHWAAALDAPTKQRPFPCHPGELLRLTSDEDKGSDQDRARAGFSRRLFDTIGCLGTSDPDLPVGLEILERTPPAVPLSVQEAITSTIKLDRRPDGEELQNGLEVSAVVRTLSAGLYYRWRFPKVPTGHCARHPATIRECPDCLAVRDQVIKTWKQARADFRKEVRLRVKDHVEHLDSPLLLRNAAIRWHKGYRHNDVDYPPGTTNGPRLVWASEFWPAWEKIKPTVEHVSEPVWVDDWLARDVLAWAQEHVGIIWYTHDAFAAKVAELARENKITLPVYGGGEAASLGIIQERGDRSIMASIKAHGTGKNLQMFNRSLVANVPSDPRAWEQLIGRTHRTQQKRDVTVEVYRHTAEYRIAFRTVQARARFIEQTLKNRQRVALATIGWEDADPLPRWDQAREDALDMAGEDE